MIHTVASRRAAPGAAAAVLLAALLAAPAGVRAEPPVARGRFVYQLGVGPAEQGAPAVALGAGVALRDDGRIRLDLMGRVAFASSQEVKVKGLYGDMGRGDVQGLFLAAELALARRVGPLEPWIGAGLATGNASGSFEYACDGSAFPACEGLPQGTQYLDAEGSWVTGPTAAAGLRLALSRQLLLEAEVRYQYEGTSRIEELSTGVHLGGVSGFISFLWRVGGERTAPPVSAASVETARPVRPPPAEPPVSAPPPADVRAPALAPAPAPPGRCASGLAPRFRLHAQRRFRCFPDPVRGGYFCGEPVPVGEFSDRGACEGACRSFKEACPPGGAPGAACQRCVAACAQGRLVECVPGNRGSPVDEGCRLEAGAWGAPDSRVVPVSCPAAAPEG